MTRNPNYGRPAIDPDLYAELCVKAAKERVSAKEHIERLIRQGLLAPRLAAALAQVSDDLDIFGYDDLLYEAEAAGLITTPVQDTDP